MEIIFLQGIAHMEIHYCFPLKKVKIVQKVRMGSLLKKNPQNVCRSFPNDYIQ